MSGDEPDPLWQLLEEYGEASAPTEEATSAAWTRLEASASAAARPELGGDPSSSIWTRGHSTWRLAMAAGISVAVGVGVAVAATAYFGGFGGDAPITSAVDQDTDGPEPEAVEEEPPSTTEAEPDLESCETACSEWAAQRELSEPETEPEPEPEPEPEITPKKTGPQGPKTKKKKAPAPSNAEGGDGAASTLAAERRVLSRAQSALSKGFYAEAERHLAEHARDYEHGLLEDLRLGLQTIVACKRGQAKLGAKRLGQLRKRFPSAPIVARAEAACSE